MREVMSRLGYEGEHRGDVSVHRDQKEQIRMVISGGKAYDSEGRVLFRNSVELLAGLRGRGQGGEAVKAEAFTWLADQFGPGRATAAYMVEREQAAVDILDERRRAKGEQEKAKSNERMSASVREATRVQEPAIREHTRDWGDSFVHER